MIPRGIRNNNPGNLVISRIPWKGKIPKEQNTDGKFEQFLDMIHGIRAMMKDLINDIKKGLITMELLLSEYAPKIENDLESYIKSVERETGLTRIETLNTDKKTICMLVKAISKHENGGYYITNKQIEEAWEIL